MSDLETLKREHPFWDKLPAPNPKDIFDQDVVSKLLVKAWKEGGVAYSPSSLQTEITAKVCRSLALDLHSFCSALLGLVQQHEATIAELKANALIEEEQLLAVLPEDWGAVEYIKYLESEQQRIPDLVYGLETAQAELAKVQATIQQQARELEAMRQGKS